MKWTIEEDEYIKEHIYLKDYQIAEAIGRKPREVTNRRLRVLNIHKEKRFERVYEYLHYTGRKCLTCGKNSGRGKYCQDHSTYIKSKEISKRLITCDLCLVKNNGKCIGHNKGDKYCPLKTNL
jgi:hypothetical protein